MLDSFKRLDDASERKQLHCSECKRTTIHGLEARCRGTWDEGQISGGSDYSIFRCGACDNVCFEKSSWDSESFDHDEDGNIYCPTHDLQYPPPSSASFVFNTTSTPAALDTLIEEMMYAFAGSKLTLATVGLRMVIEFITKDKECPGRDLQKRIDALRSQDLIDERQASLLQKIRRRGNAGAHEAAPMNTRELVAGMGVVELLLEKLYNGPARDAEVMRRAELALKEAGET